MIEFERDLWTLNGLDALCITTNGAVNADGKAVMGKGVAREALVRFPGIDTKLGRMLQYTGNHVYLLTRTAHLSYWLVSFPTKNDWRKPSSLRLIEQSALELKTITRAAGWRRVALPRPGCDLGGLCWPVVRNVLIPILDERFIITSHKEKANDLDKSRVAK